MPRLLLRINRGNLRRSGRRRARRGSPGFSSSKMENGGRISRKAGVTAPSGLTLSGSQDADERESPTACLMAFRVRSKLRPSESSSTATTLSRSRPTLAPLPLPLPTNSLHLRLRLDQQPRQPHPRRRRRGRQPQAQQAQSGPSSQRCPAQRTRVQRTRRPTRGCHRRLYPTSTELGTALRFFLSASSLAPCLFSSTAPPPDAAAEHTFSLPAPILCITATF